MAANTRSLNYFGITVTLTANTTQRLLTLLQSVDANVPPNVRELNIQDDPNSPADLLIGDSQLSTSRIGTYLQIGQSKLYRSGGAVQAVPVSAIYLRASDAAVVNVEGWC